MHNYATLFSTLLTLTMVLTTSCDHDDDWSEEITQEASPSPERPGPRGHAEHECSDTITLPDEPPEHVLTESTSTETVMPLSNGILRTIYDEHLLDTFSEGSTYRFTLHAETDADASNLLFFVAESKATLETPETFRAELSCVESIIDGSTGKNCIAMLYCPQGQASTISEPTFREISGFFGRQVP